MVISDAVKSYERARRCVFTGELARQLLHPKIAQKVWASFLRGDYDTACFARKVEVEAEGRKMYNADFGIPLMWKAFGEGGPLVDDAAPKAERQALASLFAGAIGSYKNPTSHRSVTIESTEAAEMIVLASHLLGIVDKALVQRFENDTGQAPKGE